MLIRSFLLILAVALVGAACGSDDDDESSTEPEAPAPTTTTAETVPSTTDIPETTTVADETTTSAPAADVPEFGRIVEALASDELAGRDDNTDASAAARDIISAELAEFAVPVPGAADFLQPFDGGVNVLAMIPGTDLPDEYVVVGAHYDHLGSDCQSLEDGDDICNGATDNAAGVATVLEIGWSLATDPDGPSRSVILAFWDREEDDFGGSLSYIATPPVPLAATIGYVNFDIQGSNLSPSLRNVTVMVGAETGGANLVFSALAATEASTLDTAPFSLLFGQGRSDHAVFATAGVPVVFFTDANGPCYHTTGDDLDVVDFAKLEQQILTGEALVWDLATTDTPPVFDPAAPPATYDDAASMYEILLLVEPDLGLYPDSVVAFYDGFVESLGAVVDAGPDAFDDSDVATLLGGSVELVSALTQTDCDGFLG